MRETWSGSGTTPPPILPGMVVSWFNQGRRRYGLAVDRTTSDGVKVASPLGSLDVSWHRVGMLNPVTDPAVLQDRPVDARDAGATDVDYEVDDEAVYLHLGHIQVGIVNLDGDRDRIIDTAVLLGRFAAKAQCAAFDLRDIANAVCNVCQGGGWVGDEEHEAECGNCAGTGAVD